jgi:hypothetical protein
MKLLLNSRPTKELMSISMILGLLKRPRVGCHWCPILEFTLSHHTLPFSNCRLFEKTFTPIVLREVASVSIVKLKFTSNNSGSAFLIIDHMKILMTSVCVLQKLGKRCLIKKLLWHIITIFSWRSPSTSAH